MRPTIIPDKFAEHGKRITVAPPDGDLTNPDIGTIEGLMVQTSVSDHSVAFRIVVTEEELDRMKNMDEPVFWLVFSGLIPVFSLIPYEDPFDE